MWDRCPCTPPSDTTPIRCAVPPDALRLSIQAVREGAVAKLPSSTARSIWPKSIATTRPAPIFICPTSELPICPRGRPTSGPWVMSVALGQSPSGGPSWACAPHQGPMLRACRIGPIHPEYTGRRALWRGWFVWSWASFGPRTVAGQVPVAARLRPCDMGCLPKCLRRGTFVRPTSRGPTYAAKPSHQS